MADMEMHRTDSRAVLRAVGAATQWRLLLLWVAILMVPAAIVSLPLWRALGGVLDHSVHALAWAGAFHALAFGDTLAALAPNAHALGGSALLALVLTILLVPFLNGMVVGSALAGRVLGFGHLLQCGVVEYACMARLLLWSIPVYAAAAAIVAGAFALAGRVAQHAVLESSADRAFALAVGVLVLLWIMAQVVLDGARAALMADAGLRSATRALGRGGLLLLRRPLPVLGYFLAISVIGYAVALVLALLRTAAPRGNWLELVIAVLLAQLIVLAVGWVHVARMFVLRMIARELPARRRAPPVDAKVASAVATGD